MTQVEFNLSYAGFTSFDVHDVNSLSKSGEVINFTLHDAFLNPVSNVDVIVALNEDIITLKAMKMV